MEKNTKIIRISIKHSDEGPRGLEMIEIVQSMSHRMVIFVKFSE